MEDRQAEEREELDAETEAWVHARPAERLRMQLHDFVQDTQTALANTAERLADPGKVALECARLAARLSAYKHVLDALETGELE